MYVHTCMCLTVSHFVSLLYKLDENGTFGVCVHPSCCAAHISFRASHAFMTHSSLMMGVSSPTATLYFEPLTVCATT